MGACDGAGAGASAAGTTGGGPAGGVNLRGRTDKRERRLLSGVVVGVTRSADVCVESEDKDGSRSRVVVVDVDIVDDEDPAKKADPFVCGLVDALPLSEVSASGDGA